MDLRVAHGARLILRRLIVRGSLRRSRSAIHIWRMTTQAKEVDVVDLEQARIGGSVRRVAGETAFIRLHRRMLEDKRPHGIGVAFSADCELASSYANLAAGLGSVGIVTVAALYEPNVDTVAVGSRELRLLHRMAAVTQGGLRLHQHEVDVGGVVRTMAAGAADAIGKMRRLREVLGLKAGLMAFAADGRRLCRAKRLEANDLGHIAAAVHVSLTRAMAALTSVLIAF